MARKVGKLRVDPCLGPLILASASPRRKRILADLELRFRVDPPAIQEILSPALSPEENAVALAKAKAMAVAGRVREGTVIGCDTLVAVGPEIMGKPSEEGEAKRILTFLSGKIQRVISGLSLVHVATGIEVCGHAVTRVYTRSMTRQEIDDYVATGECFGKAGAYAIQESGDRFIERLEGSFDNVVGFPTELFMEFMETLARRIGDAYPS